MRVDGGLTKAERADREQDDGEGHEDGPSRACYAVADALKPLEATEDLSCATSRHSSREKWSQADDSEEGVE